MRLIRNYLKIWKISHVLNSPPTFCDFCSCEAVDAVMIFITINNRRERLDNFCGNKLPAQLMSNGPTMEVEFKSYHSSQEVKGFRAIYRFVTGETIKTFYFLSRLLKKFSLLYLIENILPSSCYWRGKIIDTSSKVKFG